MKIVKVPCGKDDYMLYYAKSVRKGNKVSTKTVEKIGKLSELRKKYDDPISYFKTKAKQLTEEGKAENSFSIPANVLLDPNEKKRVMFGYIFPQRVYYSIGLDSVMRSIHNSSKFEYDFNRIMRDLVIGRILDPLSKSSTFRKAFSFPEKPDYDLHHIYKALSAAAKNFDRIEENAYKGMKKYAKTDTSVCYYDCTNFYFEIEEQDGFRNYGKSKENRPNPIVQMGLFMDRNGLPISMCVHPGNTNEQSTMIPLEQLMEERFGIKKLVVCADGGLSGNKNLEYNSKENHAFIVTKSLKKMKKEMREKLLSKEGWKRFGDSSGTLYNLDNIREKEEFRDAVFFHDEDFITKKDFRERIIVTYSETLRVYQRSIREAQVERAKKLLEAGEVKRKGVNQNDARRFIRTEHCTKDGEVANQAVYTIDEELFEKESMYDGFYAVTTDLKDPAQEIVRINKGRWEIEECFRVMKTDFEARPVYLSREDRIRSHFLVCYLALLVFRVLEQKLETGVERYTTEEILDSLRGYEAVDMESFYVGAMEGKVVKALEATFGLVGSYKAMSKVQFRKLVARSKEPLEN